MTADTGSSGRRVAGHRSVRRVAGSASWRRAGVAAPVPLLASGCGGASGMPATADGGPEPALSQQGSVGPPALPPWVTLPSLPSCPATAPTARTQLPAVSLAFAADPTAPARAGGGR